MKRIFMAATAALLVIALANPAEAKKELNTFAVIQPRQLRAFTTMMAVLHAAYRLPALAGVLMVQAVIAPM